MQSELVTEFTVTLTDTNDMNITAECPDADTGFDTADGYSWICGQGRITVTGSVPFGATVSVRLGSANRRDFMPDWSRGGDLCGNECNMGVIQL